jgi:hypothetical protein
MILINGGEAIHNTITNKSPWPILEPCMCLYIGYVLYLSPKSHVRSLTNLIRIWGIYISRFVALSIHLCKMPNFACRNPGGVSSTINLVPLSGLVYSSYHCLNALSFFFTLARSALFNMAKIARLPCHALGHPNLEWGHMKYTMHVTYHLPPLDGCRGCCSSFFPSPTPKSFPSGTSQDPNNVQETDICNMYLFSSAFGSQIGSDLLLAPLWPRAR